MKDITRVHLAKTPFNIELEAKKELEKYLQNIQASMQADDETLTEVEVRIIEILTERGVSGEKTITRQDVEAVKSQLGSPAEFIDDQDVIKESEFSSKQLMRDEEHMWVGGVLAGIAAYFNGNAMLLRLITIFLAFISFGTVLLIYIVLWIVIPPARTAADRLRMRGKPVTLASIKQLSESASDIIPSPHAQKVKRVVGVLLGICFAFAALGSLFTTIAGAVGGLYHGAGINSHTNISEVSFLYIALALAVLSGLLLTALFTLSAVVAFAWRITKRVALAAGIIIVLGLLSFSAAVGTGYYGAQKLQSEIKAMTKTEDISLQSEGAYKQLTLDIPKLPVKYIVSSQAPHLKITTLRKDNTIPELEVSNQEGKLQITLSKEQDDRSQAFELGENNIKIYGPAISDVSVKDGSFTYQTDTQDNLKLDAGEASSVTLAKGSIKNLALFARQSSHIMAEDAVISNAALRIAPKSSIWLGAIGSVKLETPKACPADSAAQINIWKLGAATMDIDGAQVAAKNQTLLCSEVLLSKGGVEE